MLLAILLDKPLPEEQENQELWNVNQIAEVAMCVALVENNRAKYFSVNTTKLGDDFLEGDKLTKEFAGLGALVSPIDMETGLNLYHDLLDNHGFKEIKNDNCRLVLPDLTEYDNDTQTE